MRLTGEERRAFGPGARRRRDLAEKRLLRNKERPHWSVLHQNKDDKFVNQPWLYKKPTSPSYRRVQQQQQQPQAPRPVNRGYSDPFLKHQNYMANNFMDAARARYQHMKNDPAGYRKAQRGGYSNNDNFYAPINKHKVLRMRHQDDWNRRSKGLPTRNWKQLF